MDQAKLIENVGQLQASRPRAPGAPSGWPAALALLRIGLVLVAWQAIVMIGQYQTVILPAPERVAREFMLALTKGTLLYNLQTTLIEIVLGLVLGVSAAAALGYLLAHWEPVERFLAPYLVASQATPAVAIAPLLYIWFGAGLTTKVLVCALIVFFPVLINVVVGVRSVEPDLRDLMRTLRATRWQTFVKLELPAALPVMFGGLKIGATLAVIGAIVGELQGGEGRGLWFYTNYGLTHYDTPQVFVGVITMMALAMTLYGGVSLVEKRVLKWKE
jgi:NitT/TauT family transport system permease protein